MGNVVDEYTHTIQISIDINRNFKSVHHGNVEGVKSKLILKFKASYKRI